MSGFAPEQIACGMRSYWRMASLPRQDARCGILACDALRCAAMRCALPACRTTGVSSDWRTGGGIRHERPHGTSRRQLPWSP